MVMKQVRDAMVAILDRTTLADVQEQSARARTQAAAAVAYSI
jgi:DNA-binding IscR family transcriptional regulator